MYYYGKKKLTEGLFRESVGHTVTVDIETESLEDTTMLGVGIATSPDDAFYLPMSEFHVALEVLRNPLVKKVYHNAMFDLDSLYSYGVDVTNIGDTAILARLQGKPGKLTGLAFNLAATGMAPYVTVFGMDEVLNELLPGKKKRKCSMFPEYLLAEKCALDVKATYVAWEALIHSADASVMDAYSVDMQVMPILLDMFATGIKIDQTWLAGLIAKYERLKAYYLEICQSYGLQNPGSSQQTSKILQERGVLFPKKKHGKWEMNTKRDTLKYITDIVAQATIQYRHAAHTLSTYLYPCVGLERMHTHFHLDAATGRMSSYGPNLMNIPKGVDRGVYIPDVGPWTCVDASQMQLRILAHLSQDPVMLRIFAGGGDIHQETANYFGMPRNKLVKSVNFGVVFGATAETLMDTANDDGIIVKDIRQARTLLNGWGKKYKVAWEWITYVKEEGVRHGYIYTDYGRKLYIPVDRGRAHAERCCVNYPIQGAEAEAIKRWMLECRGLPLRLVVHDELIFDGLLDNIPELEPFCNWPQPMGVKTKDRWS